MVEDSLYDQLGVMEQTYLLAPKKKKKVKGENTPPGALLRYVVLCCAALCCAVCCAMRCCALLVYAVLCPACVVLPI